MGKESREEPSGCDETEAHHVGVSPQEDRGGAAGKVGEGEDCEEEVGCLAACGACCCEYAAGFGA